MWLTHVTMQIVVMAPKVRSIVNAPTTVIAMSDQSVSSRITVSLSLLLRALRTRKMTEAGVLPAERLDCGGDESHATWLRWHFRTALVARDGLG